MANRGCGVCDDPESPQNQIVTCDSCKVRVHLYCYGIKKVECLWKCSPCSKFGENNMVCVLCKRQNGAMKSTVCKRYVHVICALFTSKVEFVNVDSMEPIDISSAKKSFKLCHFCKKSTAYSTKCVQKNCANRFHVTCAQRNKTLKEYQKSDGSIEFVGYCMQHKKSGRRLSSDIVKKGLEKKKMKELKDKSAHSNAAWVYEITTAHSSSTPNNATALPIDFRSNEKRPVVTDGKLPV